MIINCTHGAYLEKDSLISFLFECNAKEGVRINDAFVNSLHWQTIKNFMNDEDEIMSEDLNNIAERTLIWINSLVREFPMLLNGTEFEDFVDEMLTFLADSVTVCRIQAMKFLALSFRLTSEKVRNHLIENNFINYCAEFLSNDNETILDVLYVIDIQIHAESSNSSNEFNEFMNYLTDLGILDDIDELSVSDNEKIASAASNLLVFINSFEQ